MLVKTLAAATAAALALAGCSATPAAKAPSPSPSQPAAVAKTKVVTAFYALEYLAKAVGGEAVTVETLVGPGVEPHDLELTPKQVADLGKADLVVYQAGFQAAVDKAIKETQPKNTLDPASFLPMREASDDHEDHDGHEGEHKEEKKGDGHDHGKYDPHTWLDPSNMAKIAEKMGAKLAELNPAAKDAIAANTKTTVAALTALDEEFTAGLKTCKTKTFITQHAAFGYLAKRYGLEQEGISGLDPETEPTAARVNAVMKEAKEKKVNTIFYETLVSDKVAKAIAGDLNLKTDVLDPLEGINEKSRGKDYLEVMRSNLKALKTANQCQ